MTKMSKGGCHSPRRYVNFDIHGNSGLLRNFELTHSLCFCLSFLEGSNLFAKKKRGSLLSLEVLTEWRESFAPMKELDVDPRSYTERKWYWFASR